MKTYGDSRLEAMCSYCGDYPDTGDHVPSKILLDDPFPTNLPKVPCCYKCNQSFSLDEEYIACLIECVIHGTTDITKLKREKIKRILGDKEPLRQKLEKSIQKIGEQIHFQVDEERLKNVILKLARGHAKFENNEPQFEEPFHYSVIPKPAMTEKEIKSFFADNQALFLPEVGSRAFIEMVENNSSASRWTIVQENNYYYRVSVQPGLLKVQIVIWDYIFAEIVWD